MGINLGEFISTKNDTSPIGPISVQSANSDGQLPLAGKTRPPIQKRYGSVPGGCKILKEDLQCPPPQKLPKLHTRKLTWWFGR